MAELKWQAQYNDSTTLNQIDDNGEKHAYLDIDREKLQAFHLINIETNVRIFTIIFDESDGERLVWTRRVFQPVGSDIALTYHIVGKKNQFIVAITPDGHVIVRDNFVDDGLFDEVLQ